MKYIKSTIIIISLLSGLILYGCDGIFPSASKSNIPSDHTVNYGGFLHKGGSGQERVSPDECSDCHTTDIRGKVSLINGVYTWANSCYQCHGAVWERGGQNGNKTSY
ncbi:MAG: hypothetical protein LWX07_02560 [Bacteroidetes bacterium]|nr:hypothetical protein [Bacteroidota bacterium]